MIIPIVSAKRKAISLKCSDAETASIALNPQTNAVAMHRSQVTKEAEAHFGQSLLMTTGAVSGRGDEP